MGKRPLGQLDPVFLGDLKMQGMGVAGRPRRDGEGCRATWQRTQASQSGWLFVNLAIFWH